MGSLTWRIARQPACLVLTDWYSVLCQDLDLELGSSWSDSSSEGPVSIHLLIPLISISTELPATAFLAFGMRSFSVHQPLNPTYISPVRLNTSNTLTTLSTPAVIPHTTQHSISRHKVNFPNNAPTTTFHCLGIFSCCATVSPYTVSLAILGVESVDTLARYQARRLTRREEEKRAHTHPPRAEEPADRALKQRSLRASLDCQSGTHLDLFWPIVPRRFAAASRGLHSLFAPLPLTILLNPSFETTATSQQRNHQPPALSCSYSRAFSLWTHRSG